MSNKKMNGRAQAITRLIITAVLFVNAILTAKGINPIPLDESAVGEVVSMLALAISTLWSWWKNNNITQEAIRWQIKKDTSI